MSLVFLLLHCEFPPAQSVRIPEARVFVEMPPGCKGHPSTGRFWFALSEPVGKIDNSRTFGTVLFEFIFCRQMFVANKPVGPLVGNLYLKFVIAFLYNLSNIVAIGRFPHNTQFFS